MIKWTFFAFFRLSFNFTIWDALLYLAWFKGGSFLTKEVQSCSLARAQGESFFVSILRRRISIIVPFVAFFFSVCLFNFIEAHSLVISHRQKLEPFPRDCYLLSHVIRRPLWSVSSHSWLSRKSWFPLTISPHYYIFRENNRKAYVCMYTCTYADLMLSLSLSLSFSLSLSLYIYIYIYIYKMCVYQGSGFSSRHVTLNIEKDSCSVSSLSFSSRWVRVQNCI